jgi:hypothetical protein
LHCSHSDFAHGDVNGVDFWTEAERAETAPVHAGGQTFQTSHQFPHGRTTFVKLERVKGGHDSGTLRARFNLVGPDGNTIAEETQAYIFVATATRTGNVNYHPRAQGCGEVGDTKEGTSRFAW